VELTEPTAILVAGALAVVGAAVTVGALTKRGRMTARLRVWSEVCERLPEGAERSRMQTLVREAARDVIDYEEGRRSAVMYEAVTALVVGTASTVGVFVGQYLAEPELPTLAGLTVDGWFFLTLACYCVAVSTIKLADLTLTHWWWQPWRRSWTIDGPARGIPGRGSAPPERR
jgi:hypothetical protein